MKYALHGMCSLHNNVVSDIRLAKETGYDGLEIHTDKLWRYINAGLSSEALKARLTEANIAPSAIDIKRLRAFSTGKGHSSPIASNSSSQVMAKD